MQSHAIPAVLRLQRPSRRRFAMSACGLLIVVVAGFGLLASLIGAGSASAAASLPTGCSMVASPSGSNAGNGTADAPFQSAQELVDALKPGQVGCLQAGTYPGGLTFHDGGTAADPLVLRSVPGAAAEVTGRVWVEQGANFVTVEDLTLNGNHEGNQGTEDPLPSPTVNAENTTFEYDNITNEHTAICFVLGSGTWGVAVDTVIAHDEIHDCGILPANNHEHGIYDEDSIGVRITDNVIDHNADRGIQLYPDAQGTLVEGNVISENGEGIIFSGVEGFASDDNTVTHNLVVYSNIRSDIESWYPEGNPIGVGNVVQDNCVSAAGINKSSGGFTAVDDVVAKDDELVADGSTYVAEAGSACAEMVPGLTSVPATTESGEQAALDSDASQSEPQPSQPESESRSKSGSSGGSGIGKAHDRPTSSKRAKADRKRVRYARVRKAHRRRRKARRRLQELRARKRARLRGARRATHLHLDAPRARAARRARTPRRK